MDLVRFVVTTVAFAVIMYFIADFMIKKFNFATPGRNGNYDSGTTDSKDSGEAKPADEQVTTIIELLGGRENIVDVDACMTRLRVSVKDQSKVGSEEAWKKAGAMGLVLKDTGVQAIYGPKADVLKSDIQDALSH